MILIYWQSIFFTSPVLIHEFFLDRHFRLCEVFSEEIPRCVEHLFNFKVDVDGEQVVGIFFCEVKDAVVVVCEVETVFHLGACVGCVGVETDTWMLRNVSAR